VKLQGEMIRYAEEIMLKMKRGGVALGIGWRSLHLHRSTLEPGEREVGHATHILEGAIIERRPEDLG
jgi:hypothetical protein